MAKVEFKKGDSVVWDVHASDGKTLKKIQRVGVVVEPANKSGRVIVERRGKAKEISVRLLRPAPKGATEAAPVEAQGVETQKK